MMFEGRLLGSLCNEEGKLSARDWPSGRTALTRHGICGIPGPQLRGTGGTRTFLDGQTWGTHHLWSELGHPPNALRAWGFVLSHPSRKNRNAARMGHP
jgi:hypothetical protein